MRDERKGGIEPRSDEISRPAQPLRSGAHLGGVQPLGPCAQRRVGRDDLASALQRGA